VPDTNGVEKLNSVIQGGRQAARLNCDGARKLWAALLAGDVQKTKGLLDALRDSITVIDGRLKDAQDQVAGKWNKILPSAAGHAAPEIVAAHTELDSALTSAATADGEVENFKAIVNSPALDPRLRDAILYQVVDIMVVETAITTELNKAKTALTSLGDIKP
jgi:hypothetical protein